MLLKRAMFLKRPIVVTALLTIACALLIPTLSAAQTPSATSSLLVKLVDGLSAQEQADGTELART